MGTVLDLRENIAAIYIAICSDEFMIPEKAFTVLEGNTFHIKDEDVEDMVKMKKQGMTYRKIAEIYGTSDSNVYHRIRRYRAKKEKDLPSGNLERSTC